MRQKYNPYKPGDIIHAGMFVGRTEELKTVERCLFQTKNGSPQHFLILGERGIGKSSMLTYIDAASAFNVSGLLGTAFNFLTVSIDLAGCTTQLDIIRKIGRGLRSSIAAKEAVKSSAKAFYDWLTQWEVLGVRFHENAQQMDQEEVAEDLVSRLAAFCVGTDFLDGVLILIDEADGPEVEAGLGTLLKMLAERLTKARCHQVVIGLAGLPGLLSKLRDSHESSPRLFEVMTLKQLSIEERKRAIRQGLNDANEKNAVKTSISDPALDFLARLSEGFPHFIQQFAYSAFETDTDDLIDLEDVTAGATDALKQLGDKFFNDMYHARISSEDYRRVLDAMAVHGDDWVTRKAIVEESGVVDTTVNNALGALKTKQIIVVDESRRGFYRLPTKSFAAWINATKEARGSGR